MPHCKKCRFKYEHPSQLKTHMGLKHSENYFDCQKIKFNPYQCHKCSFKTQLLVKCKNHKDHNVGSKDHFKKHKCRKCKFSSFSKYLIARHFVKECHFESKVENREFLCDFCGRTAKRQQTMQRHVELEHSNRIFSCDECSFKHKCRVEAEGHCLTLGHDFSFCCLGCTLRTKTKSVMASHECLKRKSNPLCCTSCYFATRTNEFKKQFCNHFGGGKFLCGQCTFETASIEDFLKHQDCHEVAEESNRGEFNAPCILNEHYNFDSSNRTLEYKCKYCGFVTRNFAEFRGHLDRHSDWVRYLSFEHSYARKTSD